MEEKIIFVDKSIYRDISVVPPGFHPIPYRLNVNHPLINSLYVMFKKVNELPVNYPLSDAMRLRFENKVLDLIKEGRIVVVE